MRITGIKVDKQSCPITGGETNLDAKTPSGALAEFYCAFNKRDLALMEQNWLPSPDISMEVPLAGSRRGWPEIREVYQRIFASAASLSVEFYDYVIHEFGTTFLAIGRERKRLQSPHATMEVQMRTSRFYVLQEGRWWQFHHHGSVDDPKVLQRYQAAIL
jgi:ketosteroid isomerase-like protein